MLTFSLRSKLALCPSCLLHWLTCWCWKDLSLFLKREGRTKSHPLARKANSPLRSGSRRNDVSLIIIVGAETRNPPPDTTTGVATDTVTTGGPACLATKQLVKENWLSCRNKVHLTTQSATNQKMADHLSICAIWQSHTLTKSLFFRLHLNAPAPKVVACTAVIQQHISVKRCCIRSLCYCEDQKAEPWYWAVFWQITVPSGDFSLRQKPTGVALSTLDVCIWCSLTGACRFKLGSDELH